MGSALAWLLYLGIMVVIVGVWMKIANYLGQLLHISDLVEWVIGYFSGDRNKSDAYSDDELDVHDYLIEGYSVDLKNGEISFDVSLGEKRGRIGFKGVLAHRFSHEIAQSLILDIEEMSVDQFIKVNRDDILAGLAYGWPVDVKTVCELESLLKGQQKRCYVISASSGLNGWIIGDGYRVEHYT